MSHLIVALLSLASVKAFAPAWGPAVAYAPQVRSGASAVVMNAFAGLARKMKEKEIAGMREEYASLLEARGKVPAASGDIASRLKKRSGALSCVAEYRRKGANIGNIDEVMPPYILSREFRTGGADVLSVLIDKATGACTLDDVAQFVKEQQTAKNDYPGPVPIIWHDLVIDEVQLAIASNAGAKGVILSFEVLGDDLGTMMSAASEYGLEVVVEVRSAASIEALAASGLNPSMVALSGVKVEEATALMPVMPDAWVKVYFLPVYDDKQLIEAEDAWRMRDAGCNSIFASEVLFKFGMADGEHTMSIIKAIKSKGSVKYARASGAFTGKGEGAKEYLGTIEM